MRSIITSKKLNRHFVPIISLRLHLNDASIQNTDLCGALILYNTFNLLTPRFLSQSTDLLNLIFDAIHL